jgi:hypothetical protein
MMEPGLTTKLWRGALMIAALGGIVALVGALLRWSHGAGARGGSSLPAHRVAVAVHWDAARGLVIDEQSSLSRQLARHALKLEKVRFPALTVSGVIVARLRAGEEPVEDRWQFTDANLTSTYADWLRTRSELEFSRRQLAKTIELTAAETDYLDANLRRIEPLWKGGNLPEREYKSAKAELLRVQLQGEKDVFAAESTLRVTMKTMTALERALAQEGIEPAIFEQAREPTVIVSANVPESKISRVRIGQECLAQFYAFPGRTFSGHVGLPSSLLTRERRTLRVLFQLTDAAELLRPGMFAEVGLGTDEREALLVPAESLLHVNHADYVLVEESPGLCRPAKVRTGEQFQGMFELLEGPAAGQTVIGSGAILLQPALVQAMRQGMTK